MAKVRFRGEPGTRLSHQVGPSECVHVFESEALVLNPDTDQSCTDALELYSTYYPDVPITSQPNGPKPADKETA